MRIESVSSTQPAVPVQDKKLKQACKDFEAIYMGMMLKSMRKTVDKTDLFGSSKEEETFTEMMDTEVCKAATERNSIGIADILYKQISAQEQRQTQNETRGGTR